MFSFNKGRALAKIKGGEYDGEIIYIKSDNDKCCEKCSEKCCYTKKRCCKLCNQCCGKDDEEFDEIELENSKLITLPNTETREIPYVAGPSGSGKSTHSSKYVEVYKKLFPEKMFLLFSRKDNDPILDKLNPTRILINEELVNDPIDITKELSGGAIVLFDDVTTIQDDKVRKAVEKLMMDIMEVGRSYDVYIIITNHLVIPNEKKFARTLLNEIQSITIFPKSGSAQQIRYALKTYFGFNNKQIDKVIGLPSRWVTIYKTYPQCVVYETGCYIP